MVSKPSSWALWTALANSSNLWRGQWEPQIFSWLVRSTGDHLDSPLASEVGGGGRGGQSCGTEPVMGGISCYFQINGVITELNHRTPSGCHREFPGAEETPCVHVRGVHAVVGIKEMHRRTEVSPTHYIQVFHLIFPLWKGYHGEKKEKIGNHRREKGNKAPVPWWTWGLWSVLRWKFLRGRQESHATKENNKNTDIWSIVEGM